VENVFQARFSFLRHKNNSVVFIPQGA